MGPIGTAVLVASTREPNKTGQGEFCSGNTSLLQGGYVA